MTVRQSELELARLLFKAAALLERDDGGRSTKAMATEVAEHLKEKIDEIVSRID